MFTGSGRGKVGIIHSHHSPHDGAINMNHITSVAPMNRKIVETLKLNSSIYIYSTKKGPLTIL